MTADTPPPKDPLIVALRSLVAIYGDLEMARRSGFWEPAASMQRLRTWMDRIARAEAKYIQGENPEQAILSLEE